VASDVDAVQSALLAVTVFLVVAGFVWAAGRLRDAKLLALLAEDERRLERLAERVRELAETAIEVGSGARPREAFGLAQLRLAEALATVATELPNARRLILLEPEHAHRVRAEARAAIAEISDRTIEAEIDRDTFTHGFRWARKRRRAIDARIDAPGLTTAVPAERRAA